MRLARHRSHPEDDALAAGDTDALAAGDTDALAAGDTDAEAPRLDLRNTWQVAVGSVLIPLGVALILMAWYGTAHTRFVQQQIPYLVSGSFAGLGCMVLGGLLYWSHWLYRVYDQADLHHRELLELNQRMIEALEVLGALGALGAAPERAGEAPGATGAPRIPVLARAPAPHR